jgi:hypothetical protein
MSEAIDTEATVEERVDEIDQRLKSLEESYRTWKALPTEDITTWRKRWDVELLEGIHAAAAVVERVAHLEQRADEAIAALEEEALAEPGREADDAR